MFSLLCAVILLSTSVVSGFVCSQIHRCQGFWLPLSGRWCFSSSEYQNQNDFLIFVGFPQSSWHFPEGWFRTIIEAS